MNMTLLYFVEHCFCFFIMSSKYTGSVLTGEEIYYGKLQSVAKVRVAFLTDYNRRKTFEL